MKAKKYKRIDKGLITDKDPMSSFESLLLMKQQMSEHLNMDIVNAFIKMLHKQGNS
jgi:hypothetical protein